MRLTYEELKSSLRKTDHISGHWSKRYGIINLKYGKRKRPILKIIDNNRVAFSSSSYSYSAAALRKIADLLDTPEPERCIKKAKPSYGDPLIGLHVDPLTADKMGKEIKAGRLKLNNSFEADNHFQLTMLHSEYADLKKKHPEWPLPLFGNNDCHFIIKEDK